MRRRMQMLFKMGLTVIIVVSVVLFYLVNSGHFLSSKAPNEKTSFSDDRVRDGIGGSNSKVGGDVDSEKQYAAGVIDTSREHDSGSDSQNNLKQAIEAIKVVESDDTLKYSKESNAHGHDNLAVKAPSNTDVKHLPDEMVQNTDVKKKEESQSNSRNSIFKDDFIHLSVVACGERLEETVVMLKSAVLQSRKLLQFHIFADDDLREQFKEQLESWPENFKQKVKYNIYPITFPKGENANEWKTLFKPCASQRLFLPLILTDVDSLLYVDTDILFMRPIDDVWSHFEKFNSSHIAALAPEHEEPSAGWYNRFARHPFYGRLGVNSGVMLMNLTKLRQMDFVTSMIDYYKIYKFNITWGDQDLINILFHYHPDKLYVYECDWNYRPDHCMYMSVCKPAERNGVSVLHGCRSVFHNDKQPTFKAVYNAFAEFKFGSELKDLLSAAKRNMASTTDSQCGKIAHVFSDQLERQVNKL